MSLNLYDRASQKWRQTWIDADGLALFLEGELKEGKMTLASGPMPMRDGQVSRHRITWSPLPEGRVRQLWERSTEQGRSWSVVFDGIYIPRTPRHGPGGAATGGGSCSARIASMACLASAGSSSGRFSFASRRRSLMGRVPGLMPSREHRS